MLDFYLMKDASPIHLHGVSQVDYLGGIDYDEFEQLQYEGIIGAHLDYYQDHRWTSEEVAAKLELLNKAMGKGYKITGILAKAKEQQSGVVAYCD